MQTSQEIQTSPSMPNIYDQPMQDINPYIVTPFQIMENNRTSIHGIGCKKTKFSSHEQYFTLDSLPTASGFLHYDSPSAISALTTHSPFSNSHSYGSPMSGSSTANEEIEQWHKLRKLEILLLGPEPDMSDSFKSYGQWGGRARVLEIVPSLDLKQLLVMCAEAISDSDTQMTSDLMEELEKRVSISGDPIQRLGAYLLEGLRARLESSGSLIYGKLRCIEPTSSELMSYMSVLYQICPYWKFAYESANAVIYEAMRGESRIHIIDFQIAQGTQWVSFIEGLAARGGQVPLVRITGVDDSQSAQARGGGLDLVALKLTEVARSCGVEFEFHNAAMSGHEVRYENLGIRPDEAIAVTFPYVLHHVPDESVSIDSHRDRLIRLVKSLSPKVVTLAEQESNTNTSPFIPRFKETLDYYSAMFESIDAGGSPQDSKQRISAEQHCVARDIVNMVACEGGDRVERHELFGKWRVRFEMAGFHQIRLGGSVTEAVRGMLREFSGKYRVEERDGAVYLWWLNRAMVTSSAWR